LAVAPRLLLYNFVLLLAVLVVAPIAGIVCVLRPGWRRGLAARLGLTWPRVKGGKVLWAHAASVGEMEGIAPLVRRWQLEHPGGAVVVSALTATGCAAAERLLPGVYVRTFPLDLPWIVRRVIRRVRPGLFLFTENEIWPNAILALERRGVPTIQVSGRLSSSSAAILRRFPGLSRAVVRSVTCFCVQSPEHRDRLFELGVDPARVVVTGSLKGENDCPEPPVFLRVLTGVGRRVVVAGSTHRGEEAALLHAVEQIDDASVLWVIAPRHPERFAEVATLLSRRGIPFARRSALPADASLAAGLLEEARVLLLDTIGELAGCYALATVAFVGGTLAPIGGHNLLEPARCGVPIVVGPNLKSVAAIADRLVGAGAATIVGHEAELASAFGTFLDPVTGERAGAKAREVALGEGGGLGATWEVVNGLDASRVAA
jgi:3-deoxy-D-manno-octulosonic-acid transferase